MATYQEKISNDEAEIQQLLNRIKGNKQKLKAQQSKERTHRICQRGGYIEKILPDTIPLTAENFQRLIDEALCTNFARNKLTELLAEQERQSTAEDAATDAPTANTPAASVGPATPPAAPAPANAPHPQPPKTVQNANSAQGVQRPQGGASHNANPLEAKRVTG
jgi:hypothetical protein